MDKFLESVRERDFDRRISEVVEMLEEKQLYGTISLIKDLKYHLDLAVEEKVSCNCQHNSNSRDDEPCCRCDSKQTNADRIRSMTDEELAKYLPMVSDFICQPTEECIKNTMAHRGECEKTEECAMKWLCAESEDTNAR